LQKPIVVRFAWEIIWSIFVQISTMGFLEEIKRRRTFGIISHPDAGKTTLTEKLLLFGGAIQEAGAVKSNKIKKTATSDFMEIERQRGISVATSVLAFVYKDKKINILDTPGHKDFAEDTFRTLTACGQRDCSDRRSQRSGRTNRKTGGGLSDAEHSHDCLYQQTGP
jgi:hypothetical protein